MRVVVPVRVVQWYAATGEAPAPVQARRVLADGQWDVDVTSEGAADMRAVAAEMVAYARINAGSNPDARGDLAAARALLRRLRVAARVDTGH